MILFLESETPVDVYVIQLYMHVMATANDDMLKSQVQVKCQCMQLFIHVFQGMSHGSIVITPPQPLVFDFWLFSKLQTVDILLMSQGYWAQLQVIVGVRSTTLIQKLML